MSGTSGTFAPGQSALLQSEPRSPRHFGADRHFGTAKSEFRDRFRNNHRTGERFTRVSDLSKRIAALALLTWATLLVHGYHPWTEDAEIYLPGVEKILHPNLFPAFPEFFQSHARLTVFPNIIAGSASLTHVPWEWLLFLWQIASVLLLLLACWQLSSCCFADERARWGGVLLTAALLTLPVAGTALYVMDQYINPRNLAASFGIFSIAAVLGRKYVQAGFFLLVAALIHPLMACFSCSFCALLWVMRTARPAVSAACIVFPISFSLARPSEAYHQAALLHSFHYLTRWQWYEWLGALGPLAILWWFHWVAQKKNYPAVDLVCRALVVYGSVYFVAGLVLSIPVRFEGLARLQPMRSLHLLYIVFIVLAGGFLGTWVLKDRWWRWLVLFTPLCAGMFVAQRALFPGSPHLELPGMQPENQWLQAFIWARDNTSPSALFALDPYYMAIPGEDHNGFRAVAQRSRLADVTKDSGAVSMFPPMADEWLMQVRDQQNWRHFQIRDLQQLQQKYGVTWVVLQSPGIHGLECPFRNRAAMVCRLNW
jgi:hypothetical protein